MKQLQHCAISKSSLKAKLQQIAQKRGLTMTGIVTQAIWDLISTHKEEI